MFARATATTTCPLVGMTMMAVTGTKLAIGRAITIATDPLI